MTNNISPLEKFIKLYGRLPTEVDPQYLEMLRMGRYRVIDVPDVQPGTCCNCGASKNDGRKYIDVGRHVEWYGAIFFCGLCLNELARAMGLFEEMEAKLAAAQSATDFSLELLKKGDEIRDTFVRTLEEMEKFYGNLPSSGISAIGNSSSSNNNNMGNEASASKSNANSAKPRVTKPADVTGRKNVPSLTDLVNGTN